MAVPGRADLELRGSGRVNNDGPTVTKLAGGVRDADTHAASRFKRDRKRVHAAVVAGRKGVIGGQDSLAITAGEVHRAGVGGDRTAVVILGSDPMTLKSAPAVTLDGAARTSWVAAASWTS